MRRLGVDVGGTFTDLISLDDVGGVRVHKVPSTPADPSAATMHGALELCEAAGVGPGEIDQFFHGTTVATNIIIEHAGAEVGLITTRGFRDILHIARHKKPLNWSNFQDLPWQSHPLARRRNRIPVTERVTAPDGEVLLPLAEDEVRDAVRTLKAAGVEAIAVCFLFSFLNPEHERRAKEIVLEEFPEAFLSVRHEVLPQYREYEGFSTVCLNAYVGPKVSRYVRGLAGAMQERGFAGELHLMTSAGGVMTAESAAEKPVSTLFSGPVAGLIGGIWVGRTAGMPSVISLDVGGTSADIGVAPAGEVRMRHLLDTKVGNYHAMIPMVEMDTIGAGGGSVAYVDAGGIFRVGPRSAGADPGPACYGRGGEEPAATDCLLVLGRLPAGGLLGGRVPLDESAARAAIETRLCEPLHLSVEEAALAALKIQTHTMVQAIEENSVRRGYDPRDFALVAFGGGGPLYACDIAQELGIPQVVIPPHPGITSAMGLLATNVAYDYVKTKMELLHEAKPERLEGDFRELEEQAAAQLARDGFSGDQAVLERSADCRYVGQGYELRIALPPGPVDDAWLERASETFHDQHERRYYRRYDEAPIQIVNIHAVGVGTLPELALAPVAVADGPDPSDAETGESEVTFVVRGATERLDTRHYDRALLKTGHEVAGPAIIHQFDSTTVVNPGLVARVDAVGNLLVDCSAVRDTGLTSLAPDAATAAGPESALDPVTLRVVGGAFNAVAHEMAQTAMRMSFSSIIRESEDLGAGLFDAEGEELCESDTTPLQAGPLPWSIRGILERMRETGQEIEDGDVFIHNHPYHGASHSPDVMIAVPIFHEGRHVAWSACVAHLLDIGGSAPGINPDSIDLWAEGKIYWALKLHQRGVRNEQLWRHIFENVRTGRMNEGDVEALLSACLLGRDRLLEVVGKYGLDAVMTAASAWKDYSEAMLRRGDREDSRRRLRGAARALRQRRANARQAAAHRDEGDREGKRPHRRPRGHEPRGADRDQRALPGLDPDGRLFHGSQHLHGRGHLRRVHPAERGDVPSDQGAGARGLPLQPELPALVLLTLPAAAAPLGQHQPRARARARRAGDGGQLGALPLLRIHRLRPGGGRVLGLPRGQRGRLRRPVRQGRARLRRHADPEHAQQPDRGARVALSAALRALRAARRAGGARQVAGRHRHRAPEPVPRRGLLRLRGHATARAGSAAGPVRRRERPRRLADPQPGHVRRGGDQRDGDRSADPRRRPLPDRGAERRRLR